MIGIIGGTGTESLLESYDVTRREVVNTSYGSNPEVLVVDIDGVEVAYLLRHDKNHSIPPHRINYRANIEALSIMGVKQIYATNSVGSLDTNITPGSLLIPDNFIDFTDGRKSTFFDDEVVHIDCSHPYCETLRGYLTRDTSVHPYGVYIATNGPRFESSAEIEFYKLIGGKVIGMTGLPEVVLAKERQMCYASICVVTNYAAGISKHNLTVGEVVDAMKECEENLIELITKTVKFTDVNSDCGCQHALNDAII
ncbi:MAG: 5'-methylthioadenosine phosphorylase [Methanosphaera sp. rholeuAM74]|nr:MAG: 5'-methylthioadenosine phosphorylase [Methanosphaera sp. rholeuAM74]